MSEKTPTLSLFLKIILSLGLACTIVLYTVGTDDIRFRLPSAQLRMSSAQQQPLNWTLSSQNPAYYVDQPGCRMPSFPVFGSDIDKFLFKPTVETCRPSLTQSDDNGAVWLRPHNRSVLLGSFGIDNADTLGCQVVPLVRQTDQTNVLLTKQAVMLRVGHVVHVNVSFVRVECEFRAASSNSTHKLPLEYHYFVKFPEELIRNTTTASSGKINVLTLGLDSVSRQNFQRQMKRSAAFMRDQLSAIEMFGYNKVADNTFPNLIPALSGLDVNELKATCLSSTKVTVDGCSFIWDMYKKHGYATAFGEDMASIGLFHYNPKGFKRQPTDFRLHPLVLDMERKIASKINLNTFLCLGSRRPVDMLLDYIQKIVRTLADTPYFSFFWSTSYTHDFLNYPQLVDDELAETLNDLHGGKWLNNTFLVLMSDHGLRWGPFRNTYQGMMEDRQPFMYLVPPRWFAEQHPAAYQNLLINRRRLTTHFDLYETYRDLLEPATRLTDAAVKQRTADLRAAMPMPRGISLFLPVPAERTCAMAAISPHWCTCHEKQTIDSREPKVLEAARFIVQQINGMVKPFGHCRTLSLDSITDANVGASNVKIMEKRTQSFSDLTVRLVTKPGRGEFETTVRMLDGGRMVLTGGISRTNVYGRQSECVDDGLIKMYCYCDNFVQ